MEMGQNECSCSEQLPGGEGAFKAELQEVHHQSCRGDSPGQVGNTMMGVWRWGYELIFEVHSLGSWEGEGLLARGTPTGPSSGSSKPCTHKKVTLLAQFNISLPKVHSRHQPQSAPSSRGLERGGRHAQWLVCSSSLLTPGPPSAATEPLLGAPRPPCCRDKPPAVPALCSLSRATSARTGLQQPTIINGLTTEVRSQDDTG